MSHRDRIADFINRFPGKDDDEISAALNIEPRQTVNQICRALERAGKLVRRSNLDGKLGNYPFNGADHVELAVLHNRSENIGAEVITDTTKEWFWEGNVTDAVAKYLVERGWKVLAQADTRTKEQGLDLHARLGDQEVVIEVKGYPSHLYRDQSRQGQRKPTRPSLQAQQWYSHAMLKVMRLRSSHPTAKQVVAFPDFPRYRTLFEETKCSLDQLGIAVMFVSEAGHVEAIGI